MILTSHGHSDVGFVREKNEDSFLVDEHRGIYAVADGVGGLPFGALASKRWLHQNDFTARTHPSTRPKHLAQ